MKDKIAFSKFYECIDSECRFLIDQEISTVERDTKEMPLTRKTIEVKEFAPIGENEAEGYISTREIDFSCDIVVPEGVMLDVYQRHPVVLFNHDKTKIIGKCTSLVVDEYGIKARIDFAPTEFAQDIRKLVKHGSLSGMSIGFIPVDFVKKNERKFAQENYIIKQKYPEYKGNAERIIKSHILLEFSMVANGDNYKAGITAKQISEMEIKSSTLEMLNLKCSDCEKAKQEFKEKIEEVKNITENSTNIDTKEDIVHVEVVKQIDRSIKIIKSAKQKEEEVLIEERKAMLKMELKEMEKEFTKRGKLLRY